MCGRFSIYSPLARIEERFNAKFSQAEENEGREYKPRYNAAPMQFLPIITNEEPQKIAMARWGFLPGWSRDESMASRMINARAEGISEKRAYRHYFKEKRCLVPANNFFEWSRADRQPYLIRKKGEDIFAFAGLWSRWEAGSGNEIITFTIITTESNNAVFALHDRMPVILRREDERKWLSWPSENLLKTLPDDDTEFYPVSREVNNFANDSSGILEKSEVKERQSGLSGFG